MMKKLKFKRNKDEASILTKRTNGEKVVFGVAFVFFVLYTIVMLYPVIYLIINSFQDAFTYTINYVVDRKPFSLPTEWHFENYVEALKLTVPTRNGGAGIPMLLFNSLWFCFFSVAGQILMSSFTGYVMSKYKFKGRQIIWTVAIFSMTIPIVGNMASTYKLVSDLHIVDSPLFIMITSLSGWGFNFMVMYGFFQNVSWSYAEAVFLDGGSHLTAFFKVMLPQAIPSMVTLAIVRFIQSWNDYMTPLVYMRNYPTLASGIYQLNSSASRSADIPFKYALLVISSVPVVVLFACFSDTIMNNLSVGGLKG